MTRPVDVDGTPLHVGDLVETRWDPTDIGTVDKIERPTENTGWLTTISWDRDGVTWDGYTLADLLLYRKRDESRHDRIVRMSYVRPQVVQVEYGPDWRFRDWAVIAQGRPIPVSGRRDALHIARTGLVALENYLAMRNAWTVL